MDWLLALAFSVFVSYWVIRTAVHHGVRDADRSRAEDERARSES